MQHLWGQVIKNCKLNEPVTQGKIILGKTIGVFLRFFLLLGIDRTNPVFNKSKEKHTIKKIIS